MSIKMVMPFNHLIPCQHLCTWPVANGFSNTVSFLTEKQCKVNVWDGENRSPLTKAVPCDKESCATILLEHSADPNLVDLDGNTALHFAACCQSVSLAAKVLKHKANLEAQNKVVVALFLFFFLITLKSSAAAAAKSLQTVLMIALSDEPTSLVNLLLQQEVDLSCQDIYGFTAEEYASFNGFTM
ncbi:hypothetical protein FD755_012605 [Muntiacus reevesi]|uniref:Uncharacterized protein n=1 Tax=Muntiacus reevesi TaxID=9886 RepID=A0A5N3XRQ5_MUNRE|nr:hypothetical protein FD755_012605 [Muntiacus reevesi]